MKEVSEGRTLETQPPSVDAGSPPAPPKSVGYRFMNGPWENCQDPCLTMDDPEGGDPHIIGVFARVYNSDALAYMAAAASDPQTAARVLDGVEVLSALRMTERNLGSLIAANQHYAMLMKPWREAIQATIAKVLLVPHPEPDRSGEITAADLVAHDGALAPLAPADDVYGMNQ